MALVVKNLPANAEDIKYVGLIPGLGRSSRGRHGNSLQYSCLENPMDRGAWRATVHRVSKSQTRLKWLSTCVHSEILQFLSLHLLNAFWLLPNISNYDWNSYECLCSGFHLGISIQLIWTNTKYCDCWILS